jgi:hypothetical protein
MTNWPTKKLGEEKRDNFYYLMEDILSCFPDRFEDHFLGIINHHLIAKEATRQILVNEIKQKKPRFRILAGALILQNSFLHQMQRIAMYEVIDTVPALKFCFRSLPYKTIKKLSAEAILRLFCTLYLECVLIPGRKAERGQFISQFRRFLTVKDIIDAMNTDRIVPNFIFERHGINLGYGKEADNKLSKILEEFFTFKES